jgi:hypothetical protein
MSYLLTRGENAAFAGPSWSASLVGSYNYWLVLLSIVVVDGGERAGEYPPALSKAPSIRKQR